ncbi:MAG: hypothetical protein EOO06_07395 [Chitinophagaceae bacterium]|nr:MAG: hypothetical protein EOO06_07395 [Chitinophagaceae bacterium]
MPQMRYIPYAEIDKVKWDRCIQQSDNGFVYSTSMYLDHMAGNWDAIVLNDYEAVLPLPWRRKWGIQYVFPPSFTQQLGITSKLVTDDEMFRQFIAAIPQKFRFIELNLNSSNKINPNGFFRRQNYLLNLAADYNALQSNYSRSASRNLRKAKENNISVTTTVTYAEVIALHKKRFEQGIGFTGDDYDKFSALVEAFNKEQSCYCIGAMNSQAELIAGSIYLIYKDRLYFVLNGNTAESFRVGATHLLMDHTIREFSGKNFVLDFEGSDHASFARFYEQYGAQPETYYFIRLNRLPWPVSLLKRSKINPVSTR